MDTRNVMISSLSMYMKLLSDELCANLSARSTKEVAFSGFSPGVCNDKLNLEWRAYKIYLQSSQDIAESNEEEYFLRGLYGIIVLFH